MANLGVPLGRHSSWRWLLAGGRRENRSAPFGRAGCGLSAVLAIVLASTAVGQETDPHFVHLGEEQGLETTRVNGITEDGAGFIWFATGIGLSRFDGYTLTTYRNTPQDPSSLASNYVRSVHTDREGRLWAGSANGLSRWDPAAGSFVNSLPGSYIRHISEGHDGTLWLSTDRGVVELDPATMTTTAYNHRDGDERSLSFDRVLAIVETGDRSVWVATDGGGASRLDPEHQSFRTYRNDPADVTSLSHDIVMSLFEDSKGRLWLGTPNGLNLYDPVTDSFVVYAAPAYPIRAEVVFSICEEAQGRLWVASYNGLSRFDPERGTAVTYSHSAEDRTSLASNKVRSLFVSRDGLLWIGTYDAGIDVYDPRTARFAHYRQSDARSTGLSQNNVMALLEDRDGVLWVGTYGGGLNRLDEATGRFESIRAGRNNPRALGGDAVFALLEDSDGDLWIGTQDGGLNRLDRSTGAVTRYRKQPDDPHSLSSNAVRALVEGPEGGLWVGTRGGGLNRLDRETGRFTRYVHSADNEHSISSDSIFTLARDAGGFIWIGTEGGGANRLDPATGRFTRFQNREGDSSSLSQDYVWAIFQDSRGTLWIGTDGGGLDRFDPATGGFVHLRMADGLSDDVIYGILEDREGRLWLSHNKGLDRYDPVSGAIQHFDREDGLQSNEFNPGACHAGRNGRFYFGGVNGFSAFDPRVVEPDPIVPPVVLTDFLLVNRSATVGASGVLPTTIGTSRQIELGWRDSIFAFEFSALSLRQAKKRRFAYQLAGFDRDWVVTDWRDRKASYTNLGHGQYVFRVKAANADGEWGQNVAEVDVRLLPPPWKTWWAYTFYALAVIGAVVGLVRTQQAKVERERAISSRLRQADTLKDEFLANTSHELRTPLNGIIGIADSLLDGVAGDLSEETNANLRMIVSSGRRLYHLVNDILDFSKLRNRDLALQLGPVDMHTVTDVVLALSRPLLGEKPVELVNEISRDTPAVTADENRMQQILHNLVGNAVKFTESGKVAVSARVEAGRELVVCVSDTGIGIAEDARARIFRSFEQADGSTARAYGGTGLGLAVSKQLVELHGGRIWVESEPGSGSRFHFSVPLSEGPARKESQAIQRVGLRREEPGDDSNQPPVEQSITAGSARVLVVDDEPVNLQVVSNYLSLRGYSIVTATNGEEALAAVATGDRIDLVVLDVMMPKMSGYEVCRRLRESHLPSRLPVVLLTAKNQVSDLVEGFAAGASDFLTKPFSRDELLSRVELHLSLVRINDAFERFVPQPFLSTLGCDSAVRATLGDQTEGIMTVLFSDIRSYTTLSEGMTPKENFDFINGYLRRVGPVIEENHGFVNQYYGDGIMAIFPESSADAIRAGIEMQRRLVSYNESRALKGRCPVKIGVGIHTGRLMLGIIGDNRRLDTGVISDTVNTAARMEGLTKYFGSQIIVSGSAREALGQTDDLGHRYLGRVRVKGRVSDLEVYEVYESEPTQSVAQKELTRCDFESALRHYAAGRATDAIDGFEKILANHPDDQAARRYLKQAARLAATGLPEGWTGVEAIREK